MNNKQIIKTRMPCKKCGHMEGFIERKANNDVVRCCKCTTFIYNAPRSETGNF